MCGISAFCGVKNLTPIQKSLINSNIKILGLFNQTRGEHGCGVYINGEIIKGYDNIKEKKNTKLFRNFIGDDDFILPKLEEGHQVILAHSRAATVGSHSKENNHPFYIESIYKDKSNFTIVHNGTISNIKDLCNKYDVEYTYDSVDSYLLGLLIDKVGLQILEEYVGYAALVWTKDSEPGSLYVYHGASKKEDSDKVMWIERPMFYLKSPEGIYFSSMPESLNAIRESEEDIVEDLKCNTVFKVTNGKFTNVKTIIERSEKNIGIDKKVSYYFNSKTSSYNFPVNCSPSKRTDIINVNNEAIPINSKSENRVFFWKNRYFLSNTKELCHGLYNLDKKGYLKEEFKFNSKPYWFYEGVLLKDGKAGFEKLLKDCEHNYQWLLKPADNSYALFMTDSAAHPITNHDIQATKREGLDSRLWYSNGKRISAKTVFSPKFSSRTYHIDSEGYLIDITTSVKHDVIFEKNIIVTSNNSKLIRPKTAEEGWIYEQVLESVKHFTDEASELEKLSLDYYILEYLCSLNKDKKDFPTEDEINEYVTSFIRRAVNAKSSIKNAMTEVNYFELKTILNNHVISTGKSPILKLEDIFGKEVSDKLKDEIKDYEDITPPTDISDYEEDAAKINYGQVCDKFEDIIDVLQEVNTNADELLEYVDVEMAQEFADVLYKNLDNMKHKLIEVTDKYRLSELTNKINRNLTIMI